MVGARMFLKAGSARLYFTRWSGFDGYIAIGKAFVTAEGLEFFGDSILLKTR